MTERPFFPATAMPDDDWWHALWPDPMGVLVRVGLARGMTVVDLCCGNGHFTAPLASLLGPEGRVYALDMVPDMLTQAQKRMAAFADKKGVARCVWLEGDACKIDAALKDEPEADALLIANTFHGVPDQTALSLSVRRTLAENGLFIVINWHLLPREETIVLDQPRGPKTELRMPPERVATVIEPAGYKLKQVIELPPYHYAAVFHIA